MGEGKITRRAALKAAPAAAAALAVPAVALGDDPTGRLEVVAGAENPLRALYHEWQALKDAYDIEGADEPVIYGSMIAIERQVTEFVPRTVEDWAFKIIFADDDGDMNTNSAQPPLVKMAYDLVGIPPRYWRSWDDIYRGRI